MNERNIIAAATLISASIILAARIQKIGDLNSKDAATEWYSLFQDMMREEIKHNPPR